MGLPFWKTLWVFALLAFPILCFSSPAFPSCLAPGLLNGPLSPWFTGIKGFNCSLFFSLGLNLDDLPYLFVPHGRSVQLLSGGGPERCGCGCGCVSEHNYRESVFFFLVVCRIKLRFRRGVKLPSYSLLLLGQSSKGAKDDFIWW